MPGRRRIVLDVSAELYRRMEDRATKERVDLDEWHLRTLIVALLKKETPAQTLARLASYAQAAAQTRRAPAGVRP